MVISLQADFVKMSAKLEEIKLSSLLTKTKDEFLFTWLVFNYLHFTNNSSVIAFKKYFVLILLIFIFIYV